MRIYNFGAGPAGLPNAVVEQIKSDLPGWYEGMSVMELSHRLPKFTVLTREIEQNIRILLSVPDEFAVLFMHGGARMQFSAIPLNFLNGVNSADYLVTGHWSQLAFSDAQRYCQPHLVAHGEPSGFTAIPAFSAWCLSERGAYLHYTDNETVHGVAFHAFPKIEGKWLISDMTSSIATKVLDFSPFGLIYASTQKNLGIAGGTLVLVRRALLGRAHPLTPPLLDYTFCATHESMCNTPPVFAWYVMGLVVQWALAQGGLQVLESLSQQKGALFYEYIDKSRFYSNVVDKACRSHITIPFHLPTPALEKRFLEQASAQGFKQLQGHKVLGGLRACFYNAMPLEGVAALIDFMRVFEAQHG